jgi:hypothetical protein
MNRIAVEELISTGVVEQIGHYISDFRATTLRQWQSTQPGLNLDGSDAANFVSAPLGNDPST